MLSLTETIQWYGISRNCWSRHLPEMKVGEGSGMTCERCFLFKPLVFWNFFFLRKWITHIRRQISP